MQAALAGARIPVQIDVGFGDSTEPGLIQQELPTLLEFPAPRLRAYRPETVISEKLEAIVKLGIANSRMKDFYDLYVISRTMTFECGALAAAVRSTFARRGTPIPKEIPIALTDAFAGDAAKLAQWRGFAIRSGGGAERLSLAEIIADIGRFLLPVLTGAAVRDAIWTHPEGWT